MSIVSKAASNLVQKALGTYFEGPNPPPRIAKAVEEFGKVKPSPEWEIWATTFAEECYRSGYMRGLEWAERDYHRHKPIDDPEVQARIVDLDSAADPIDGGPEMVNVNAVLYGDAPPEGLGRSKR